MDIGTSDCDVLLLVEDLDKLKPVLCQAQAKWYELGTKLGFSQQVLHEVEEDQRVNAGEGTGFMSALLEGWGKSLDPALPSWAHLIKCLRDVEEHDVAKAVKELAPLDVTWFTNNNAIMVDARKDAKTLTWPAQPFDETNYKLNTTAYFNLETVPDQLKTYNFYTPAFQQYATPKNQKYVLAVVEKNGSYVVKFVNDATVTNATSTYTKIILEDYPSKAGVAEPDKRSVSMHVKDKSNNKVYLSPGKSSTSKDVVTTSPNPASFMIKFYPSTI